MFFVYWCFNETDQWEIEITRGQIRFFQNNLIHRKPLLNDTTNAFLIFGAFHSICHLFLLGSHFDRIQIKWHVLMNFIYRLEFYHEQVQIISLESLRHTNNWVDQCWLIWSIIFRWKVFFFEFILFPHLQSLINEFYPYPLRNWYDTINS